MNRDMAALDALKGLSALAFALAAWSAFTPWAEAPGFERFHLFIDFFFVASGFVLAGVYRGRIASLADLGAFAALRFARLYPIHLFYLLPLIAVEGIKLAQGALGDPSPVFADANLSVEGLAAHLTLTQAFGLVDNPGWNEAAWYIAAEFWVACLFALACLAGLMDTATGRAGLFIAMLFAAGWLVGEGRMLDHENGGAFARAVYGFGAGVTAHSLMKVRAVAAALDWAKREWPATAEALAIIGGCWFFVAAEGVAVYAAPLVFAGLAMIFVDGRGLASLILRTSPFRLLGVYALSIYMSHFLIILPLRLVAERSGLDHVAEFAAFGVGFYLVLTIIMAMTTEALVEAPARAAVERWLSARRWAARQVSGWLAA